MWDAVEDFQEDFQFLIKGYFKRPATWPYFFLRFQFLIKGYKRVFLEYLSQEFPFNSSLKDTKSATSCMWKTPILFQFLIKGYKEQGEAEAQACYFQFLIKGYGSGGSISFSVNIPSNSSFNSSLKDTRYGTFAPAF